MKPPRIGTTGRERFLQDFIFTPSSFAVTDPPKTPASEPATSPSFPGSPMSANDMPPPPHAGTVTVPATETRMPKTSAVPGPAIMSQKDSSPSTVRVHSKIQRVFMKLALHIVKRRTPGDSNFDFFEFDD